MKLIKTGTRNYKIGFKQEQKVFGLIQVVRSFIQCPVYSVDWKAAERNKYAPWGRNAY